MALEGVLIAESLRSGGEIHGVTFKARKIWRTASGEIEAGQPTYWTLIEFETPEDEASALAEALEGALAAAGGWYCDFRSPTETFVVFAGRTFRYLRGDPEGRAAAAEYGRSQGVPEAQLDWPL